MLKEFIKRELHFIHVALMVAIVAMVEWWRIVFVVYILLFLFYYLFFNISIEIDEEQTKIES